MSSLTKLFGKEKKLTPEESIQKIRESREMLEKKQDFLEKKIDAEIKVAKANAKTNKRVALQALKRKKRLEDSQNKLDGVLANLDLLQEQLEHAHMNAQVTNSMHQAATTLNQIHKSNKLDKIEDMMYDIEEQVQNGENINEALSRQVGFGQDVDEDDLEAELNGLMQEDLDRELLDIGESSSLNLPDVPSTKLPAAPAAREEEDDLRELEAWASAS
jgi:division protein CdvB (Snf7/Vps24/ESCRT-III family)